MRVLLIKTSSMGDVIHVLPALTDAANAIPGIQFDWMVEESFAEIPSWHPAVGEVIPISLRHWRKHIFSRDTVSGLLELRQRLHKKKYDLVLDAQGLVKSAFLSLLAKGNRAGLDFRSARESLASFVYDRKCKVNFYQHAVLRMRLLFSQALGYPMPETAPSFGLQANRLVSEGSNEKYIVFLHGTTWVSKEWPEEYWQQLAVLAADNGYRIKISGGNAKELARAKRIASSSNMVDALPRLKIAEMARLLANAKAAVAVDTGFGHLAAALDIPTISIYGSTNPEYTSALGKKSVHLAAEFPCAPCLQRTCSYRKPSVVTPACYSKVPPARVWAELEKLIIVHPANVMHGDMPAV
jgi:heptosyltransferase-1